MGLGKWILNRWVIKDDLLPEKADVIIALGSGLSPDGYKASPQSAANARKAAELFAQGKANYVLLAGGYQLIPGITEAHAMTKVIADSGVPGSKVLLEIKSTRTWYNAENAAAIMIEFYWKNAIIVCQPLHSRRVRATFRNIWKRSGIRPFVVKAKGQYGNSSQKRFANPLVFLLWDLIALTYSKFKGYI